MLYHRLKKLLCCIFLLHSEVSQAAPTKSQADSRGPRTESALLERGPHHQVLGIIETRIDENGVSQLVTNRVTEIGTGLNHLDEQGNWKPSEAKFELFKGGARASLSQHKVLLNWNHNANGSVHVWLPDGGQMASHVYGLAYFDPDTGQAALIAETKDSRGEMVAKNQVLFPNAFTDIKADVRYTLTIAGLEQDVILRESLPALPEGFGPRSRLEVWTEFPMAPTPRKISSKIRPKYKSIAKDSAENVEEMEDETLDFGKMEMGRGKAFLLGEEDNSVAPVAKTWMRTSENRTFLVEAVLLGEVTTSLKSLPGPRNDGAVIRRRFPSRMQAFKDAPEKNRMQAGMEGEIKPLSGAAGEMAAVVAAGKPGLVLDWSLVNTSMVDAHFKGDETYWVRNPVDLTGTKTTFEGGTVIKFTNNVAGLKFTVRTPIVWEGSAYRPVVFTAQDDHSVGQKLGNAVVSGTYATTALSLDASAATITSFDLAHIRIAYAQTAIELSQKSGHKLKHLQLVNCTTGFNITGAGLYVGNVLFHTVGTCLAGSGTSLTIEHASLDSATTFNAGVFGANGPTLRNSLIYPSIALGPFINGGAVNLAASNPFQTVKGGFHYLPNGSVHRDAGVNTLLDTGLAKDLKSMTTDGPVELTSAFSVATTLLPVARRDTNNLDVGYHYVALDYIWSGLTLNSGIALNLRDGVAIGLFGTTGLNANGPLTSVGKPNAPNRITILNSVQEKLQAVITTTTTFSLFNATTPANTSLQYTDISFMAAPITGREYSQYGNPIADVTVRDSQFRGVYWANIGQSNIRTFDLKNSIFERCSVSWGQGYSTFPSFLNLTLQNMLFSRCNVSLTHAGDYYGAWSIYDNLFDNCISAFGGSITVTEMAPPGFGSYLTTRGYNAYVGTTVNPFGAVATDLLNRTRDFVSGPLGAYYYPASGTGNTLATLVDADPTVTRTPASLGLFQHTTRATTPSDAVSEGFTSLDIGFHYPPANANGDPSDVDGDGVADVLETGPTVTVPGSVSYSENDTKLLFLSASPSSTGKVTESDWAYWGNGWIVASFTDQGGAQAENRLGLYLPGGSGSSGGYSALAVQGTKLLLNGVYVADFAVNDLTQESAFLIWTSAAGAPLKFTFNSNANVFTVDAVLKNIVYRNNSDTPSSTSRKVSILAMDGERGISKPTSTTLSINAINDTPWAYNLTYFTSPSTPVNVTLVGGDVETSVGQLVYTLVEAPSFGTLSAITGSTVTYTPPSPAAGASSVGIGKFRYRVTDLSTPPDVVARYAEATVTVHVGIGSQALVNAGPDQRVFLPGPVRLSGAVGGAGTTKWFSSGPAPATFTLPDTGIRTDATFALSGIYNFRLQLTSGSSVYSDSAQVTVDKNEAPVVDGGADLVLIPGQIPAVTLTATAKDDWTAAGSLSYQWYYLAGPSGAPPPPTFAAGPSVTLPVLNVAGKYFYTVRVRDEQGATGSAEVSIHVVDSRSRTWTRNADFEEGDMSRVSYDFNKDMLVQDDRPDRFRYLGVSLIGGAEEAFPVLMRMDPEDGRIVQIIRSGARNSDFEPGESRNSHGQLAFDPDGFTWSRTVLGQKDINDVHYVENALVKIGNVVGGRRHRKNVDGSYTPDPTGTYVKGPFRFNNCIDRDGDGYIHTSGSTGMALDWIRSGEGPFPSEFSYLPVPGQPPEVRVEDECICGVIPMGVSGASQNAPDFGLVSDPMGNIWLSARYPDGNEYFDGYIQMLPRGSTTPSLPVAITPQPTFSAMSPSGIIWGAGTPGAGAPGPGLIYGYNTRNGAQLTVPVGTVEGYRSVAVNSVTGDVWYWIESQPGQLFRANPDGTGSQSFALPLPLTDVESTRIAIDRGTTLWLLGDVGVGVQDFRLFQVLVSTGQVLGNVAISCVDGVKDLTVDGAGRVWVAGRDVGGSRFRMIRVNPALGPATAVSQYRLGDIDRNVLLPQISELGSSQPSIRYVGYEDTQSSKGVNGSWTARHDSGVANNVWGSMQWYGWEDYQRGARLRVEVRASNLESTLASATWQRVHSWVGFAGVSGRYAEVRVTFNEGWDIPAAVGKWSMDQELASAVYGLGGTITLNPGTSWVQGQYLEAVKFDGVTGNGTAVDSPSLRLSQFTLAGWVNPSTDATGDRCIVGKGLAGNQNYSLWLTGGTQKSPQVRLKTATTTVTLTAGNPQAQLLKDKWYHLAATYDGSTLRLFVDGVEYATQAVSGGLVTSTDPVIFGAAATTGGGLTSFYNGVLDEVYLLNQVYTSSQLKALMNRKFQGIAGSWKNTPGLYDVTLTPSGAYPIVNDNPHELAVEDKFSVSKNSESTLLDVLANDVAGMTLSYVGAARFGEVWLDGNAVRYRPVVDFVGEDRFSYTVQGAGGKLDRAVATVMVSSMSTLGLTEIGDVATREVGVQGNGFAFDGINDSMSMVGGTAIPTGSSAFSLSFWFKKRAEVSGRVNLVSRRGTGGQSYGVWLEPASLGATDRRISFELGSGIVLRSFAPVTVGQWTHVTATYTPGTVTLYVDGLQSATATGTASVTALSDPKIVLGMVSGTSAFAGSVDQVAIWSKALSAAEAQSAKAGTLSIPELVALWDGNETVGSISAAQAMAVLLPTVPSSPTWVSGKSGSGLWFPGNGVQLTLAGDGETLLRPPATAGADSFYGVSFWIKPDGNVVAPVRIFGRSRVGIASQEYFAAVLQPDANTSDAFYGPQLGIRLCDNSPTATYASYIFDNNLLPGVWHHVVCNLDQGVPVVYIDNVLANSSVSPTYLPTSPSSPGLGWRMGPWPASGSVGFAVDELLLFARAIRADDPPSVFTPPNYNPEPDELFEVSALFRGEPVAPLEGSPAVQQRLAYWPLDEGSGNLLFARTWSGTISDGTRLGTVSIAQMDTTAKGGPNSRQDSNGEACVAPPLANPLPLLVRDTASMAGNTSLSILYYLDIDVLANDRDPDGGTITIANDFPRRTTFGRVDLVGSKVRYTPDADAAGVDRFVYTAYDDEGQSARATVTVKVAPISPPSVAITSIQQNPAPTVNITPLSPTATFTLGNAPLTSPMELTFTAVPSATSATLGTLGQDFLDGLFTGLLWQEGAAPPTGATTIPVVRVEFWVDGLKIGEATEAPWSVVWRKPAAGKHTATAVVVDRIGLQNSSFAVTVNINPPGGAPANTAPVVSISAIPQEETNFGWMRPAVVRNPLLTVAGTITDNEQGTLRYQWLLKKSDGTLVANLTGFANSDGMKAIIGIGGAPYAFGPSDAVNLSSFANGNYELHLKVTDGYAETIVSKRFILESPIAIGRFTHEEQDLTLPTPVLPIAIQRSYDSGNPIAGDFGYGWTWEIYDLGAEINEYREEVQDAVTGDFFSMRTGGGRDVTLRLPGGGITTFRFDLKKHYVGDYPAAKAIWEPEPGIGASLSTLSPSPGNGSGDDVVVQLPGFPAPYWWQSGPATPWEQYDPSGFKLRLQDGTEYEMVREDLGEHDFMVEPGLFKSVHSYGKLRVREIRMRDGSRITITGSSITQYAPSGDATRGMVFERNASGLITAIYDQEALDANGKPTGAAAARYEYDGQGNLVRCHKLANRVSGAYETTTYSYELASFPHYLTKIVDPFGVALSRQEYHDTPSDLKSHGKLKKQTLANGRMVQLVYTDNPALITDPSFSVVTQRRQESDSGDSCPGAGCPASSLVEQGIDAAGNSKIATRDGLQTVHVDAFNADGELTESNTTAAGVTETTRYSTAYYPGMPKRVFRRKASVEPPSTSGLGKLVTYEEFDLAGNAVIVVGPNEAGTITGQATAALGDLDLRTSDFWQEYEYDTYGRQTKAWSRWKIAPDWLGSDRILNSDTTYTSGGTYSQLIEKSQMNSGAITANEYYSSVQADGRYGDVKYVVKKDGLTSGAPELSRELLKYDKNGNRTSTTAQKRLTPSGSWTDWATTVFQYDARNRVVQTIDSSGGVASSVYDNGGRLSVQTDRSGASTRYLYGADGSVIETQYADGTISRQMIVYELLPAPENATISSAKSKRVIVEDRHTPSEAPTVTRTTFDELGRSRMIERGTGITISIQQVGTTLAASYTGSLTRLTKTETTYDYAGRESLSRDANDVYTKSNYDELGRRWRVMSATDNAGNYVANQTVTKLYGFNASGGIIWTLDASQYEAIKAQFFTVTVGGASVTKQLQLMNAGEVAALFASQQLERLTRTTYDSLDRAVSVAAPRAAIVGSTFDASAAITQTKYNAQGQRWLVIDADNKATAYVYDALGRISWVVTDVVTSPAPTSLPSPLPTSAVGWLPWAKGVTRAASDSTATQYKYDDLGNLVAQIDGNGNTTTFAYDVLSRRVTRSLPLGETEYWVYDVSQTGDPSGAKVKKSWHVDFNGASTIESQNLSGQTLRRVSGNGGNLAGGTASIAATVGINPLGSNNALKFTSGTLGTANNGVKVSLVPDLGISVDQALVSYDSVNRLVAIRYRPGITRAVTVANAVAYPAFPVQASLDTTTEPGNTGAGTLPANTDYTYSYTSLGQRASMQVGAGPATRYAYDALGRLRVKKNALASLYYTYDPAGNVTSINARKTYTFASGTDYLFNSALLSSTDLRPNGAFMEYVYDGRNRLIKVNDAPGAAVPAVQYGYSPAGNPTSMSYGNGVTTTYDYNGRQQLRRVRSTLSTTLLANFDYDEAGESASVATTRATWGARLLSPSGIRNRLADKVNNLARTVDYNYDGLNRLTKELIGADSVTYDSSAGYSDSAGFDSTGNRRSRSVANTGAAFSGVSPQSAFYDSDDRIDNDAVPTSASTLFDANGNRVAQGSTTYTYDSENRIVSTSTGVSIQYDGDGTRASKTVGSTTTFYLIDDANPTGYPQVLEEQATAGANPDRRYLHGLDLARQDRNIGTPANPNYASHYFGYDGLGTVRYLTSVLPSVAISDTYSFDAFGVPITTGTTGTTSNHYKYTGEQWDADLGMYYLRARYYHPDSGRFWTMDSYEGNKGNPLSLHKFLYCHASPVNGTDLGGHEFTLVETISSLATSEGIQSFKGGGEALVKWEMRDMRDQIANDFSFTDLKSNQGVGKAGEAVWSNYLNRNGLRARVAGDVSANGPDLFAGGIKGSKLHLIVGEVKASRSRLPGIGKLKWNVVSNFRQMSFKWLNKFGSDIVNGFLELGADVVGQPELKKFLKAGDVELYLMGALKQGNKWTIRGFEILHVGGDDTKEGQEGLPEIINERKVNSLGVETP